MPTKKPQSGQAFAGRKHGKVLSAKEVTEFASSIQRDVIPKIKKLAEMKERSALRLRLKGVL
jgi:hypothetical protein